MASKGSGLAGATCSTPLPTASSRSFCACSNSPLCKAAVTDESTESTAGVLEQLARKTNKKISGRKGAGPNLRPAAAAITTAADLQTRVPQVYQRDAPHVPADNDLAQDDLAEARPVDGIAVFLDPLLGYSSDIFHDGSHDIPRCVAKKTAIGVPQETVGHAGRHAFVAPKQNGFQQIKRWIFVECLKVQLDGDVQFAEPQPRNFSRPERDAWIFLISRMFRLQIEQCALQAEAAVNPHASDIHAGGGAVGFAGS